MAVPNNYWKHLTSSNDLTGVLHRLKHVSATLRQLLAVQVLINTSRLLCSLLPSSSSLGCVLCVETWGSGECITGSGITGRISLSVINYRQNIITFASHGKSEVSYPGASGYRTAVVLNGESSRGYTILTSRELTLNFFIFNSFAIPSHALDLIRRSL